MFELTGALSSVLGDDVKKLSTCWRIERTDGVTLALTDHNARLGVNGQYYYPVSAPSASAMQRLAGLKERSQEIIGAIVSDNITDSDLHAGRYRGALVVQMLVDWSQPSSGVFYENHYKITSVEYNEEYWRVQLTGITSSLVKPIGRYYNRLCDADLGDDRCKKDLTSFTHSGHATNSPSIKDEFNSNLTQADGFYDNGILTWTSGDNDGIQAEVDTYVNASGKFSLFIPLPYPIQSGDNFTAIAGCKKRAIEDCKTKFDNIVNHRGFNFIPGNDSLLLVPDAK